MQGSTAAEALALLQAGYCEGLILPPRFPRPAVAQLFGRPVQLRQSADLSFLAGLAAGGLRTAAIMTATDLANNLPRLREMARNHIPTLITCLVDRSTSGQAPLAALKHSGCFILSAANAQDAVFLALIGQRIAEAALAPGVLLLEKDENFSEQPDLIFPEASTVVSLLGDPDESIASPTPAQQMLFGKTRRRVPDWYHFDYPTLAGADKSGLPAALEYAANAYFFDGALPEIANQVFADFQKNIPACPGAFDSYQVKDADYIMASTGMLSQAAKASVDQLRSAKTMRAGYVHLALIHPIPKARLTPAFFGKKGLTWFDPGTTAPAVVSVETVQEWVAPHGKHAPGSFQGRLLVQPDSALLQAVFENMLPKGGQKSGFFAGINFSRTNSEFPQHEILLQTIERNFPEISQFSIQPETLPAVKEKTGSDTTPRNIHRQKDLGPPYARAARFYHNTAALYTAGAAHELVADPFQALPVAPAGTATLAGRPQDRTDLPVFKPELCTACGACMVHCPHAALPSLAINVEQLLRGGMEIAAKQGTPLAQLTPLVKNLGKIAGQVILEKAEPIGNLSDFLPEAYTRLAGQLNLEGEKRAATEQQLEKLTAVLKPLPVAATQKLFNQREVVDGGSGELFALALDSQACTGCGICSTVCEPLALEMTPETPELREQAAATLECWEQLPDTAPASIQRLLDDAEHNPLAALMLSRYNYSTLAGPGADEMGPQKAMIHWLTALAESIGQPNLAAMCRDIEQAIADLSENIHKILGEALPAENSSGLLDAIRDADGKRLPLDEIIARLSTQEHLKLIDTAVLQRKTQLVQALKDLLWTLKEGPTGMGRARYGLVFPGGEQATESLYPFHAFQAPALASTGSSLDLSLGLFEAQLRHTVDNIRLLRRAKLEIKNQYRPELHAEAIATLNWDQLTETEKNLAPPLLVVCNRERLPENFTGQLPKVLACNYPMKIIVLDNGALRPDEAPEAYFGERIALLQAAQSCRQAGVFMGSAGNPKVFFEGLLRGMRSHEPAFFLLYCPETGRHNLPLTAWPQLADLALNSRAVPFFEVNPAQQTGLSRAAGIALLGNPSEHTGWTLAAENADPQAVTFADWLFTLDDWQEQFEAQQETPANESPLPEYLNMDATAREGKTPVIYPHRKNAVPTAYAVSEKVVHACAVALSTWNYLREMAGTLSPHPEKLWQEAESEVAARYEARIQEIESAHAARLEQLEQEFLEKTRIKLREKLLALSKNSDQAHAFRPK